MSLIIRSQVCKDRRSLMMLGEYSYTLKERVSRLCYWVFIRKICKSHTWRSLVQSIEWFMYYTVFSISYLLGLLSCLLLIITLHWLRCTNSVQIPQNSLNCIFSIHTIVKMTWTETKARNGHESKKGKKDEFEQ